MRTPKSSEKSPKASSSEKRRAFAPAEKMATSRKNLIDLTLSASGRACFKQTDSGRRQLFLSSTGEELSETSNSDENGSERAEAWTWGSGKYGRLGSGATTDASVPAPVQALVGRAVRCMSAGSFGTAYVVDDGRLFMSGKDINQLFAGTELPEDRLGEDYLTPVPVTPFLRITIASVAVGETICAVVTEFGELYWWGGAHGSLPHKYAGTTRISTVKCGAAHALALTVDGTCLSWGQNDTRQLGTNAAAGEFTALPTRLQLRDKVELIACGYTSIAVATSKGHVHAAGSVVGQQPLQQLTVIHDTVGTGGSIRRLTCTDSYLCIVLSVGDAILYQRQSVPFLALQSDQVEQATPILTGLSVRELVCGNDWLGCVTDSGAVHTWGRCSLLLGLGEVRAKKRIVGPRVIGSFSARFVRSLSCGTAHVTACLAPPDAQREALGWELLATERIYLRSLRILNDIYKSSTKARSTLGKLFGEIESMIKPHSELMDELDKKMANWSDATTLGSLMQLIAKKTNIDMYTRFHRLHSEWSKQSASYLPGGKHFREGEDLVQRIAALRKSDSPYERKRPTHLVGLLSEPFERMRQYFWMCGRLIKVTPDWHGDFRDLTSASEAFQRELSGYYSELEMQRMTIARLEGDKEELLQKLSALSSTNDNLFLSRNNHEMQKRELTDVTEQHEHKIRTMNREIDQHKERILKLFLEKRGESILRRRAESAVQRMEEETAVHKSEARRLEKELSVARSMKLFSDVRELRQTVNEKDKEILQLREALQETKETKMQEAYTKAHVAGLEKENNRLATQLQEMRAELIVAIQKRHAPLADDDVNTPRDSLKKDAALFAADGTVRGATVKGLINLLIELDDKESVEAYMDCFFLTYRLFITPVELNYSIQELYCKTDSRLHMDPPVIWSRVLGVLRFWITEHAHDFSTVRGMKALLWGFLEETVCNTLTPATADAIMQDFHRQTVSDERQQRQDSEARALLGGDNQTLCDIDLKMLCSANSTLLVEQLILIEHTLLRGIESKELLGCQWLKSDKELRAPGIVALTRRFNHVSSWAVSEVLTRSDVKDRRDVITTLIGMAAKARVAGGINTAMELMAALNSGPVQRLKRSWALVSRKDQSTFDELEVFVSPNGSFKAMREAIHQRREKSQPTLPYVGIYLGDLVFTDEGSLTELSDGVINFARLMGIAKIIQEVLGFRAASFGFQPVAATRKYLIAAKVMDEEAAWLQSEALEPRVRDDQ